MFNCSRVYQFVLASSVSFFPLFVTNSVQAQITPDETLPTEVNPSGNLTTITGGETRGSNLFHSFSEFSVPTGNEAFFNNALDIDNILSRVTGGSVSNIDGLIRANGSANLFLINPAGIIFGPNARLDIGGSFLGSTADSILFPEGEFLATDTTTPPLLTINAPIGLNFRDEPAPIINQSFVSNITDTDLVGLEVLSGENLTLVGGDINFEGGEATAPGGRVELGGLAAAGTVTINQDGSLSFPDDVARANVTFTNFADVDVRGAGDGSITINANNINLFGESGSTSLRAGIAPDLGSPEAQAGNIILDATGEINLTAASGIFNTVAGNAIGNAGNIGITGGNLSLIEGSEITTEAFQDGNAGNIAINTNETISLDSGSNIDSSSGLGQSSSGNVNINAGSLFLSNNAFIRSSTFGQGSAGNIILNIDEAINIIDGDIFSNVEAGAEGSAGSISITARSLSVQDGGFLSTTTLGQGDSGNIVIIASDTISFENSSNVFSQVENTGQGNGGNIDITTTNLSLTNGSQITAGVFGTGNAGNVIINATDTITFQGIDNQGFPSGIINNVAGSGTGNSGDIEITTNNLNLIDGGQISNSIFGIGDGGNINLDVRNQVNISGFTVFDEATTRFSSIASILGTDAEGSAGNINITAQSLSLQDEARIDTTTSGQGDAGSIFINTSDTVSLNDSNIFSQVESTGVGNAGGIQIITDNLTLDNGSQLTAATFGEGDAGNVIVNATGAVSFQGRDSEGFRSGIFNTVEANAIGNGGDIEVNAESLSLDDSTISAGTFGEGETAGNIVLQIDDNLTLSNNSVITAQATQAATGGNIDIDAEFIIASLNENNDIIATAQEGFGGNITIDATGVFGIEERDATLGNETNDIDASSALGSQFSGIVDINTPDTNAIKEVSELPNSLVETDNTVAQACSGGGGVAQENSLTLTGRGGIPPLLTEPLTSDAIHVSANTNPQGNSTTTEEKEEPKRKFVTVVEREEPLGMNDIIPARGIIFKKNGDIILTAYPTLNITQQRIPVNSNNCN